MQKNFFLGCKSLGCGVKCEDSVLPKGYSFGRTLQQAAGILEVALVRHTKGMGTVVGP